MKRERLSRTRRLLVWSIVLDPMLFFVFADRSWVGITFAVGRVLQIAVLTRIALHRPVALVTNDERHPFVPPPRFLWTHFAIYFGLAVLAGLLGLATGAYEVPSTQQFNAHETTIAQYVNSPRFRPVVEYVIALYFFVYFALLPRYLFTRRSHIEYFFRVFRMMLIACLVVGFLDIAIVELLKLELLPRHLGDRVMVGPRFHGLGGEPRHAFAFLLLAVAVLRAEAHFMQTRMSRPLTLVIGVAVLLTQSASALIGLTCFGVMYLIDGVLTLRGRELAVLVAGVVAATVAIFSLSMTSKRIAAYADSGTTLWTALQHNLPVRGNLQFQQQEVYPMYDLYTKIRVVNPVPVLLGSGLGSASAVNNRIAAVPMQELANPNSQIVRSLFESGLVGTVWFVLAFVIPVQRLTAALDSRARQVFVVMMLLVIGGMFGVRGTTPYIYLGLLAAMFNVHGAPGRVD